VPWKDLVGDDLVALRDHVQDLRAEPPERRAEAVELLAHALGARAIPGGRLWSTTSGAEQLGERALVGPV